MAQARWLARLLPAFGMLLAWVPAGQAFCPRGSYSSTPTASYNCAFGLVNFTVTSWSFQVLDDGTLRVLAVPGGTLPALLGTRDCMAGTFSVSATYPGGCTETYSLTGTLDSPGHWTGTFRASYSGSCFGCVTQTYSLEGINPSVDVPSAELSAESLELAALPNPTRGPTLLRFATPGSVAVTLEVFDLAGRRVQTLIDHAVLPRGAHQRLWLPAWAEDGGSGMRFAKLTVGNRTSTRVLVVLR